MEWKNQQPIVFLYIYIYNDNISCIHFSYITSEGLTKFEVLHAVVIK
jgi:hypothetical protein